MSEPTAPVLSVIMPTYNRHRRLVDALEALAEQDIDVCYEIVVVSDGSTDGTDEYLADVDLGVPVVAVCQDNAGPAAARNRAIELARGEFLVFVDDDIVADRGLLSAHLAAQRAADGDLVVTGPMLTPPDHEMSPWVRWEQDRLERQYDDLRSGAYEATGRLFYTGNASVPRQLVLDAGGFDTALRRAEDLELGLRLRDIGASFRFVPDARGFHFAERSFASWERIPYDYGANEVRFITRWPSLIGMSRRHWYESPVLALIYSLISASIPGFDRPASAVLRRFGRSGGRRGQLVLSLLYKVRFTAGLRDGLGSRLKLWRFLLFGRIGARTP